MITPPNQRAAGNGGIALRFQIEHAWPAVPEHGRSASLARWEERRMFRVAKALGELLGSCRAEVFGKADIGRSGWTSALGFRSRSQMERVGLV